VVAAAAAAVAVAVVVVVVAAAAAAAAAYARDVATSLSGGRLPSVVLLVGQLRY